jgi:hypothetical protein
VVWVIQQNQINSRFSQRVLLFSLRGRQSTLLPLKSRDNSNELQLKVNQCREPAGIGIFKLIGGEKQGKPIDRPQMFTQSLDELCTTIAEYF